MRQIRYLLMAALFAVCGAAESITLHAAAAMIQTISPTAGRAGDIVTLNGQGFGAMNVRVTVGGVPAIVVSANGNTVTFRIPGGVRPGIASVVVTNPGGRAGTIDFTVLEGILLPGNASSLMKDLAFDLFPETGLSADQIVDGIAMTQLEVYFANSATVAQVNDALRGVNGGIVGMAKGLTTVTITVPRAASVAAIQATAETLSHLPGVDFASIGYMPRPTTIFTPIASDQPAFSSAVEAVQHLVPSRFPAAYNAFPPDILTLDLHCTLPPVTVIVADLFLSRDQGDRANLPQSFRGPANPTTFDDLDHGWDVANVLAALPFETNANVGANPFGLPGCLDLRLVQQAGRVPNLATDSIVGSLPRQGKAIVNYSMGFSNECKGTPQTPGSPCTTRDRLEPPLSRAREALYWKQYTRSRWPDFLMVTAAGNARDDESAIIYHGMSDARFNNEMTIAQLPDTKFEFVGSAEFWQPDPAFLPFGFTSLAADDLARQFLAEDVVDAGLAGADAIADNVIVVGSATRQTASSLITQHVTGDQLGESVFSNSNADVLAVGEDLFLHDSFDGTSLSAPIVSGLASYLWMIKPELIEEPASTTKQAIVLNARNRVLDAYATVLSLDPPGKPLLGAWPIRQTLLDVDKDRHFTAADIEIFMGALFQYAPDGSIIGPAPDAKADFSRYDLNGDGFTTAGARRERFDLDREGSKQYGASNYTPVTQTIQGEEISFNESELTDLEILCYYAYSPLFEGIEETRDSLLEGRCSVAVLPRTATLRSGQQQQFTAKLPNNAPVKWTTNAPDGSVSSAGVFTAGSTPGTYKVRATDANDPSVFGEATVTIDPSSGNFRGNQQITVRVGGRDPLTFEPLFPEFPRLSADNQSASTPPLPIRLDKAGTYHNQLGSATFTLKSDANFSNVGQFVVPSFGTHSASVSCTTEADTLGPAIGSSASGSLNIQAVAADGRTPADIAVTLGGELKRGPGVGDVNGNASFTGSVSVNWVSGGVQQADIKIKAADYSSNPSEDVPTPIDRVLNIKAPGFVEISWDLGTGCQARLVDEHQHDVETAGGSISLTYSLRR